MMGEEAGQESAEELTEILHEADMVIPWILAFVVKQFLRFLLQQEWVEVLVLELPLFWLGSPKTWGF